VGSDVGTVVAAGAGVGPVRVGGKSGAGDGTGEPTSAGLVFWIEFPRLS